jgi:hypothetical protein
MEDVMGSCQLSVVSWQLAKEVSKVVENTPHWISPVRASSMSLILPEVNTAQAVISVLSGFRDLRWF